MTHTFLTRPNIFQESHHSSDICASNRLNGKRKKKGTIISKKKFRRALKQHFPSPRRIFELAPEMCEMPFWEHTTEIDKARFFFLFEFFPETIPGMAFLFFLRNEFMLYSFQGRSTKQFKEYIVEDRRIEEATFISKQIRFFLHSRN